MGDKLNANRLHFRLIISWDPSELPGLGNLNFGADGRQLAWDEAARRQAVMLHQIVSGNDHLKTLIALEGPYWCQQLDPDPSFGVVELNWTAPVLRDENNKVIDFILQEPTES